MGGKKPERFIITTEYCPYCNDLKQELKQEIASGDVKEIDVTRGIPDNIQPIVDAFNIDDVPQMMSKRTLPDGSVEVCDEQTKTCKIIRKKIDL